jgi:hypothetical protein
MTGCTNNALPRFCPKWVKAVGDIKPFREEVLFRPTKEKIAAYRTGFEKYCTTSAEKAWNQEISHQ